MKVKTKSVERKALHFTDTTTPQLKEFIGDLEWSFASPSTLAIVSDGSKKIVSYNDYLIRDGDSVWPCKPDVFAKTYAHTSIGHCAKRPINMEAIRLSNASIKEIIDFCVGNLHSSFSDENGKGFVIKTLKGEIVARQDDYILKGVNGEVWPVTNEMFEKSYECI